jgi:hypothetical protein
MRAYFFRKRVIERLANPIFHALLAEKRHGPTQVKLHQPQVVETEDMVGMLVRVKDRVHDADLLAKQLLAQIGRGVDEQVAAGQPQNRTAPSTPVSWIWARANVAAAADHRHANAGAGAEQDHLAANVGGYERFSHVSVGSSAMQAAAARSQERGLRFIS